MYANQEAELKKAAHDAAELNARCDTHYQTNARMEKGCDEPMRENLRGRVHSELRRSMRESRKAENLQELAMLLDKNPEVARILELMEGIDKY